MSLYPIIPIDAATAAVGPNALPSGTLALIPIDMTVAQMVEIKVSQVSLTQDFSLRGWVSLWPDGISLTAYPGFFPLLRGNGLPIIVHDELQSPPTPSIAVPVSQPSIYYLNVLNLTNEDNQFVFAISVLA